MTGNESHPDQATGGKLSSRVVPAGSTWLRRYFLKPGHWEDFLLKWRQIVPLRRKHGIHVLFAVVDRKNDTFTWAIHHAVDLEAANKRYLADPERIALNDIRSHLESWEVTKVEPVDFP